MKSLGASGTGSCETPYKDIGNLSPLEEQQECLKKQQQQQQLLLILCGFQIMPSDSTPLPVSSHLTSALETFSKKKLKENPKTKQNEETKQNNKNKKKRRILWKL